jgi:hypothetical protein
VRTRVGGKKGGRVRGSLFTKCIAKRNEYTHLELRPESIRVLFCRPSMKTFFRARDVFACFLFLILVSSIVTLPLLFLLLTCPSSTFSSTFTASTVTGAGSFCSSGSELRGLYASARSVLGS